MLSLPTTGLSRCSPLFPPKKYQSSVLECVIMRRFVSVVAAVVLLCGVFWAWRDMSDATSGDCDFDAAMLPEYLKSAEGTAHHA